MIPPILSPKGSLEELFRHHLLESEAAAVPPLPHVWEQLDNSLLLAQNERYRRRLAAYRWAMAASLLLAAMAGGGWWRSQTSHPGQPTLASASPVGSAALRGAVASGAGAAAGARQLPAVGLGRPSTTTLLSSSNAFSIEQTPTLFASFAAANPFAPSPTTAGYLAAYQLARPGRHTAKAGAAQRNAAMARGIQPGYLESGATINNVYNSDNQHYNQEVDFADTQAADLLGARLASLRLPAGTGLPARLSTAPVAPVPAPKPTGPWQLQVAYAAGMFDPNIDFKKAAGAYNTNLGPGTVATTREAAAEYRQNLRPGLGQRLSVWATRRLGIGRWNLRTGLEIAQNTASSASSVGFVGEQVATLTSYVQVQPNRLQGTTYRYRSVGIPIELSYTNPMRRGFSLYGRMGALFSSLLNIHSEVDGDPEATRSYSTQSVGSPYRHLSASVRGGVGMRYEPAGRQWAFNLGPVAEAGIQSLNIDPTQSFWNQQRPYSIGLEAGMQFSSLLKPALVPAP